MTAATTFVTLAVPTGRAGCAHWLEQQAPETVADVLEIAEPVYRASAAMASVQRDDRAREVVRAHADTLARAREEHERLERALRRQLEEAEERRAAAAAAVAAQRAERDTDIESVRAQLRDFYERQVEEVRAFGREQVLHAERRLAEEREAAATVSERLLAQLEEQRRRSDEVAALVAPALEENRRALQAFSTGARDGTVGEGLVRAVFDSLRLGGELHDTRHDKTVGCEDFHWADGDMRCSVEVKYVKHIHSQKDMGKHVERIVEASRASKVNCALFLSLRCHIPNTRPIEVRYVSGVPVLYVSGGTHLTPQCVAEMGFRAMAALWPQLRLSTLSDSTAGSGDAERALEACASASALLERQLNGLSTLCREIEGLTKQAHGLLRTASKLETIRRGMLTDIHSLQVQHPELQVEPLANEDAVENDTDDERATGAILAFLTAHRRYPKTAAEAGVDTENFDALVKRARKRKRAGPPTLFTAC
ncbi:MAG: hypothetical protein ACO32I_06445 [Candidatus Limnocylindrus sp.]